METGSFILLLHSHIPYCKMAGTWPFGEEWLFEAMAETYIPILDFISKDDFFERQVGLTISFTPVLLEQMSDDYMKERFSDYLKMKISQAKGDHERFEGVREGRLSGLSEYYIGYYEDILKRYESELDRDVVKEVRRLQDSGRIEAITSAATHAYLPLFSDERSVREQISVGCETYERHMGKRPRGIWLPECGFKDDEGRWTVKALEDNGIEYFFVESHSVYPKSRQNAPSSYAVSSGFDGKCEPCEARGIRTGPIGSTGSRTQSSTYLYETSRPRHRFGPRTWDTLETEHTGSFTGWTTFPECVTGKSPTGRQTSDTRTYTTHRTRLRGPRSMQSTS